MLLTRTWMTLVLTFSIATAYSQTTAETAEHHYKNIQVLKGVPASQVEPAMGFIAAALGVQCQFCHVRPYDQDTKPAKQTARQMIEMTRTLNAGTFNGKQEVTCYTCHQGRSKPTSVPAVFSGTGSRPDPGTPIPPLPTLNDVLERYMGALGGKTALHKFSTRVIHATQTDATGESEPMQIVQKSPDRIYAETKWTGVTFYSGFNGRKGWRGSKKDGQSSVTVEDADPKRDEILLQADFYQASDIQSRYQDLKVKERQMVGERETVVVEGRSPDGNLERLYFDLRTGLLIRRHSERPTLLGSMPLQTSFEDYREVDGINIPFTVRWALPTRAWSMRIVEIKHNVPVPDEEFSPPATGPSRQ
jgi:photosynthetic reaction center cytochrome c subunit